MGKKFLALILTLLTVLMITGCAKIELNLRVKPNGSAEKEMVFAIDKQALALMSTSGQDPLQQMMDEAKQKNPDIVISRYQEGNMLGFRAMGPMGKKESLDSDAWKGEFEMKDYFFYRQYRLNLDTYLDMSDVKEAAAFLNQVDYNVSVELPAKVGSHNGQADSTGKKVTWTLVPNRKDHLTLQANEIVWSRVGIGGGALILLLLALGAAGRKRKPVYHVEAS